MQPEIRFQTAQEICATWGAVVTRICDGVRTELDDLVRVRTLFDELLDQRPVVGMLLVFTHGTPLPTRAAQCYAMNSMRELGDKLVLSVATLGLGFWADSFRATLDAIGRKVSRSTMAIETTPEAAAQRLAAELIGVDSEALLAVYQDLWAVLEPG